jgi:hypothetical protein
MAAIVIMGKVNSLTETGLKTSVCIVRDGQLYACGNFEESEIPRWKFGFLIEFSLQQRPRLRKFDQESEFPPWYFAFLKISASVKLTVADVSFTLAEILRKAKYHGGNSDS